MCDEELVEALLAGELTPEQTSAVLKRLRRDAGLRSHLIDFLAVRSMFAPLSGASGRCGAFRRELLEAEGDGPASRKLSESRHAAECAPCRGAATAFALEAAPRPFRSKPAVAIAVAASAIIGVFALTRGGFDVGRVVVGAGEAPPAEGAASGAPDTRRTTPDPAALAALAAMLPELEADPRYAARAVFIRELCEGRPDFERRGDIYCRLCDSVDHIYLPEPVMWAVADAEPDSRHRHQIYQIRMSTAVTDGEALLRALRRERTDPYRCPESVKIITVRLGTAPSTMDRTPVVQLIGEVAARPDPKEFSLYGVIMGSQETFPDDPAVAAAIDAAADGGASDEIRALALFARAKNRDTRADAVARDAYLTRVAAYLLSPEEPARHFARRAFETCAEPAFLDALAALPSSAASGLREKLIELRPDLQYLAAPTPSAGD